ncbi:MAG: hypothetical protein O7E51_03730 [Acidobacteria bacterium]|nr:hypothetical protein [Acidobacteriota bacterium]
MDLWNRLLRRLVVFGLALILHCFLATSHSLGQGIITTVAGTDWAFRGDGGSAIDAPLGGVEGVVVDSSGNLIVADFNNRRVMKISRTGILTVAAGNGFFGTSGDGGPARNASLSGPSAVALDAAGNLYIAVPGPSLIRKVSPGGIITTVAGNGEFDFSGDGGPATSASLNDPKGLAVDAAGNLYIADEENHRIRKVSPDGIITTVVGNGTRTGVIDGEGGDPADDLGDGGPATSASLNSPSGVAVDAAGNLYIADSDNDRVRKVSPDGIITTVAGNGNSAFSGDGGPATSASLSSPAGVAVDAAGNLYIADFANDRARKVSLDGIISTVAGNGLFKFAGDGGPATSASLHNPSSVAADTAGNVYIADEFNQRIRKISSGGIITTVAGTGERVFSGDGGQATSVSVASPKGVAVDAAGNFYIADTDNGRIRKVTPDGILTTVAGGGEIFPGNGDGGPATSARLDSAVGVAVDTAGNLYIAERGSGRIRKVSFEGIITTVAGNGTFGFSGDGGPATSAQLDFPVDVAVDTAGNLYIADLGNHRIRKVSPGGIITTVAGNGVDDFSGDGGPATSASLNEPSGVAVDAAGNLFINDRSNERIRKVNSSGIITTVAGGGGDSGDGGPATSANFGFPLDVAVDAAGNLYIADAGSDRIRKVLATGSSFSVTPATLSFTATAGGQIPPTQPVMVSSDTFGLLWSARESTETGGGWLAISPGSGSAPGTINVLVNPAGLSPGTFRGTVTVEASGASPSTQIVAVELTVTPALPAELAVEPASLTFEGLVGAGNTSEQKLRISNAGGGILNWTSQASTVIGGDWLSVSPSSGSASAAAPFSVQVSANVADLAAGVYSGSIVIDSPDSDPQTATVTLLVSEVTQTILVSQTGLLFTGVEGGGAVPAQTFGIGNTEQGTMNWTVEASTLGGGNWLSVSPSSGSSVAGVTELPLVEATANASGLSAGQYSGQIRVIASTANNSPQFVTVTLNVLPAGSDPPVVVRPTGLIFVRQAETSSPGSQTIQLETAAPGTLEARARPITFEGGDWLEAVPPNQLFSPAEPGTIIVQPTLGDLAPREYSGLLALGVFKDGSFRSSQTVNVLFVVTPSAAAPVGVRTLDADGRPAQEECVAQRLFATGRSLGSNFASPVAWPSRVEAQVKDDCDNLVPNAAVVASFSNGDPPLGLVSLGNGLYESTWRPANIGPVRITVRAERLSLAPAEVRVDGQVTGNSAAAPALTAGGIVNAASFAPGEALAPGSIVSVFGSNLAQGVNLAEQVPLEKTLGGATLIVGGLEQPLFFSSGGQINAQLPFALTPNSRPQMVVRVQREGGTEAISVPETITIAEARPGIFTTNQQGTGQGAILNQDFSPNSAENPEVVGNVIQVFSTGLGNTDPSVPSGQLAPSQEPLARVMVPVQAQIAGRSATVHFAGLAPGFVGLYQVNVQIPQGVEPGSEVPLVLFQNGVPSNTVTVAVQ